MGISFDKSKFSWFNIISLKVKKKTNLGVMFYISSHDPEEDFQRVDFSNKGPITKEYYKHKDSSHSLSK